MAGLSNLAFDGLDLFSHTPEAEEGAQAFAERRPPDFSPFR
jgi:1,4-dihydroxy-2-naphthoyl-CoA synthase